MGLLRRAIRVGVTGHIDLPEGSLASLRESVGAILDVVRGVVETGEEIPGFEGGGSARLILVSAVAPGADQLVADVAVARKWELQCPLPFAREKYRADFDDRAAREFDRLLAKATAVFELDGTRGTGEEKDQAYQAVGRLIREQSDLLLALWDGKPEEGPGGTGQVVREALQSGTLVVRIDPADPGRALLRTCPLDGPPCDEPADALPRHLRRLLFPHVDLAAAGAGLEAQIERYDGFLRERDSLWRRAALRMRFALPPWREPAERALPARDAAGAASLANVRNAFRRHYDHADALAIYYASLYRRLFQLNYLLGALAVTCALLSHGGHFFAWAEFACIAFIATVYIVAGRRGWHARAVGYRTLAEQLRQMRHLAPLGLRVHSAGAPPDLGRRLDPRQSWIDWHVQSILRETGMASVGLAPEYLEACRTMLVEDWIAPQAEFHRSRSGRTEKAVELCEAMGYLFFFVAAVGCVSHLLHLPLGASWLPVLLAAGAPAWGAAFHGIKSQGEYERLHEQYAAMATRLAETEADLRGWTPAAAQPPSRGLRLLALEASAEMLSEVGSWQLIYRAQPMPIV